VCKCLPICRQILADRRSNLGQRGSWICLAWSSHSRWMRCGFWVSGRSSEAHTQSALIPNREAHPCRMRENTSRSTNGDPAIAGGWLATFGIVTIHLQVARKERRSSNPIAADGLLTRASSETLVPLRSTRSPHARHSRSPDWFFGALRLGNQTFDQQNLRDTQPRTTRYHGEPAGQLGIGLEMSRSTRRRALIRELHQTARNGKILPVK
jgi:hypothetical protein